MLFVFAYYVFFFKLSLFKDNYPLIISERFEIAHNPDTGVITLKIKHINKNDVGTYTILAENPLGIDETDGIIDITETLPECISDPEIVKLLESVPNRPSFNDLQSFNLKAPHFIVPLSNARVKEGDNLDFVCKVDGNPKPKVKNIFKKEVYFEF